MYRITQYILLMLLYSHAVLAQETLTFEGERFTPQFVNTAHNGDKLLEFVREGESAENWTKLIGYRYQQLPGLGNAPDKSAVAMMQILKKVNPQAQFRLAVNEQANEAIIDFLTWPADGKYAEFNVFRYVKSRDGKAVVSLQLAYRFTDTSAAGVAAFKQVRAAWINQAVAFDMQQVHTALAP